MAEMDVVRLKKFVLLRNVVGLDFGRLDIFVVLRNMVEKILVDWTFLYYFVTW